MFFHYKDKLKKVIIYQILLGIILASIIYCREETLWIAPYVILAFLITILFIVFDKQCLNKIKRIITIICIPIIIFLGYTFTISTLNYICYDRFVTNDFTSKEFKDVYGALTRIKPTNYLKRVPLNKYDRQRLYALSPTFKKLEDFLENPNSVKYLHKISQNGQTYYDYQEGFLYWAVREAVCANGYCVNAKSTQKYYQKLSKEINSLCDNKKIECLPKRSSLIAPFQKELVEEIQEYIPKTFETQLNYQYVYVQIPELKEALKAKREELKKNYVNITYNKLDYTNQDLNSINLKMMKFILSIIIKFNYLIFMISLVFYLVIMIIFFLPKTRFKYYKLTLLINGLLCLYLSRIVVVGYVAATEYESAINKCQYLAPSYPIQSMFSVLCIIFGTQILYKEIRGKTNE